jgi:hypothetical protein
MQSKWQGLRAAMSQTWKANGKAYVQQCRAPAGQGSADVLMVEWLEQLRHHFFPHTPKALLRGKKVKEARKLVPRQILVLVCA